VYAGPIDIACKALKKDGSVANVLYQVDVEAEAALDWETDDRPVGYNYSSDTIRYSTVQYAVTGNPVVTSVSFSDNFNIDGDDVNIRDAQQVLNPESIKQLLNPALYSKLLDKSFSDYAENMEPPEVDYDPPERDYD
jgi:hypothetical protein